MFTTAYDSVYIQSAVTAYHTDMFTTAYDSVYIQSAVTAYHTDMFTTAYDSVYIQSVVIILTCSQQLMIVFIYSRQSSY